MICDFAQYYHILDWHELQVETAAILACGFPPDSRSVRALTKQKIDLPTMLAAAVADHTALLVWQKTKDGRKNRNRPKSYMRMLTETKKEKTERSFTSGKDFEAERRKLIEGTE